MSNLVYKMVRTYAEHTKVSTVDYLCKDKYIHIRLRKFGDKVQQLIGFEDKLTFLITTLMQNKVNSILELSKIKLSENKEKYQEIWKQCLECLKSSKEFKDIECVLKEVYQNYKGMKILPMYSLKNKPKNAFDLLGSCENIPSTEMKFILDCDIRYDFLDIADFLFDDNLEIHIEKENQVDNSKFINKYKEKDNCLSLWEM